MLSLSFENTVKIKISSGDYSQDMKPKEGHCGPLYTLQMYLIAY